MMKNYIVVSNIFYLLQYTKYIIHTIGRTYYMNEQLCEYVLINFVHITVRQLRPANIPFYRLFRLLTEKRALLVSNL